MQGKLIWPLAATTCVFVVLGILLARPTQTPVRFTIDDVISELPESDSKNCSTFVGEFVPAPDVLSPHAEGALGSFNGERFVVSGFSHYLQHHQLTSPRVDHMSPGSWQWHPLPQQAPVNTSHIQGATHGPNLWIAGGFVGDSPGKATEDVWRYNMQTNTWVAGPKLPSPRASGAFVSLDDELHYIGGLRPDRETDLNEHISLNAANPTDWRTAGVFSRGRNHFQAVSLGGLIYAVGGMTGHEKNRVDLPYLDVYHPKFRQWLPIADMPEGRSHAEMSTFVYKNRIIVAGGRTAAHIGKSLDTIVEYNPYKNEWTTIGKLPMQLTTGMVFASGGKLYVGGGARIWKEHNFKSWVADIELVCDQHSGEAVLDTVALPELVANWVIASISELGNRGS